MADTLVVAAWGAQATHLSGLHVSTTLLLECDGMMYSVFLKKQTTAVDPLSRAAVFMDAMWNGHVL